MGLTALRHATAVALFIAVCALPASAGATPPDAQEAQGVQAVILAHLQAFVDDDADAAFDMTTPKVREVMGHALYFMAVVRGAYPMVYRPASVTFLNMELIQGDAWQLLSIEDADGKSWLALFVLERQPDGNWRIAGCAVNEMRWKAA